jgi:hypothetical protein
LALFARIKFGVSPDSDDEPDASVVAENKTPQTVALDSRVPAGATALADDQGVIRGYRAADGNYVQLADVEVLR